MLQMSVWGLLFVFIGCPILGALPLLDWLVRGTTGQKLASVGTGNLSVSAAFYHGGPWVGLGGVTLEAGKGVAAVLVTRSFFPFMPAWELVALLMLVMGRFCWSRGAGTTNVAWGILVHDWQVATITLLISGVGFTLVRQRRQGRLLVLVVFPALLFLLHPHQPARVVMAIALGCLLALIYQRIPDDLDLPAGEGQENSRKVFQFFRGDRALVTLDQSLQPAKVGQKAATLAYLKGLGYPVPPGWVLPPGDDPEPLVRHLRPSSDQPLIVRSSAIGEDSEAASAAGLYQTIANVTSQGVLQQAILRCLTSYNHPRADQYRQDRHLGLGAMAVLVQPQIEGMFSGVAFSRDPVSRHGDGVVIEALAGGAAQVVGGQVTPERYQVTISPESWEQISQGSWDWNHPPEWPELAIAGTGEVPRVLIRQVAVLARQLEAQYQGIPQDIEWTFDGERLWLLQARPVTTLLPIWTRKIAAEVIPGHIHPLTWSVNHPLTCGVWAQIFRVVLGDRVAGLDLDAMATLHHSWAYFNASLLGDIFLRMGLPRESLEFLTRGGKFAKPPLMATLENLPGLGRLVWRELVLSRTFQQEAAQRFNPVLDHLAQQPPAELSPAAIGERIRLILTTLERVTYYNILAPLSMALRQTLLRVEDAGLDNRELPEVMALEAIQDLAAATRNLLSKADLSRLAPQRASLFANLAEHTDGETVLAQLNQIIARYGHLSAVGTDISVPTWREDPRPVRELFTQYLFTPLPPRSQPNPSQQSWLVPLVQERLNLKGKVAHIYGCLLAELRWSFVALEQCWRQGQILNHQDDIFFLEFGEIEQLLVGEATDQVQPLVAARRSQFAQDQEIQHPPPVVYGSTPDFTWEQAIVREHHPTGQILQGIGASPGCVAGVIQVLRDLQGIVTVDRQTILVVPYTDAGWGPLLAQAGGLIAEVGGRLSHGAIIAREYGIPAVMDVAWATQRLRDGQRVWLDGQQGIVEILDTPEGRTNS